MNLKIKFPCELRSLILKCFFRIIKKNLKSGRFLKKKIFFPSFFFKLKSSQQQKLLAKIQIQNLSRTKAIIKSV